MRLRVLPPVGEPIALGPKAEPPTYPGFHPVWTQSGTAALALGIQLAMERRPDIRHPEVLLPAYGCPDLVAAAVYAGARPVLVDIGAEDPGYDLECLEKALSGDVVAVVAVNFLGIRERVETLAELAHHHDAWLIEDSAQWYPELAQGEASLSPADAMVLSFGRGKPVSLLGGGALLVSKHQSITLPLARCNPNPEVDEIIKKAMFSIYNLVCSPVVYGWVSNLPFLRVGGTFYKPLSEITAMDKSRLGLLKYNAEALINRGRWREGLVAEALSHSACGILDLPKNLSARSGRMLRYPILFRRKALRDEFYTKTEAQCLGATIMYGDSLANIIDAAKLGVKTYLVGNADEFSSRLLTFPIHSNVSQADISKIRSYLLAALEGVS